MAIPRGRKVVAAPEASGFVGFDDFGSVIRSAEPVRTAATHFVQAMARLTREEFWSPARVALELDGQPEYVRSAFPSLEQWRFWTRPWDWFAARRATSAEETVRRAAHPDANRDPNAYNVWCERAEETLGLPCRFADMPRRSAVFGITITPPKGMRFHCRIHGEMNQEA